MNNNAFEKLNKVLALADSAHDGEALAALRATRNLLHNNGLNLSGMLRQAIIERPTLAKPSEDEQDIVTALQREVLSLQKEIIKMRGRLSEQQAETRYWRLQSSKKPINIK